MKWEVLNLEQLGVVEAIPDSRANGKRFVVTPVVVLGVNFRLPNVEGAKLRIIKILKWE